LHGRAVGCIVCAAGSQTTTSTLVSLRSVVHALRGWPTPVGVTISSKEPLTDASGLVVNHRAAAQLELLGEQVVEFAMLQQGAI